MYADDKELEEAMQVFLNNALSGLQGIEVTPLTKLGQIMQNSTPAWLSRPVKRQAYACGCRCPVSVHKHIDVVSMGGPIHFLYMT